MSVSVALIFSVFITIFVLFVMLMGKRAVSNKFIIAIGILLTVVFSIMAFYSTPLDGMDLQRYYKMLNALKGKSLSFMFKDWLYSQTPLTVLLFWSVSKTGVFNLLPAVSTGIICIAVVYNLCVINRHYPMTFGTLFFALFIWIVTVSPVVITTTVRQPLSFALLSIAAVRILVAKKKDFLSVLFIILPLLVHAGVLPIAVLTFLMFLFKKPNKMRFIIVIALFIIALIVFYNVNFQNSYLQYVKYKLVEYNTVEFSDMRLFVLEYLLIILLVLMTFVFNDFAKEYKQQDYWDYVATLLIIALTFINNPHICSRFLCYILLVLIPFWNTVIINRNRRGMNANRFWPAVVLTGLLAIFVYGITAYTLVSASNLSAFSFEIYSFIQ